MPSRVASDYLIIKHLQFSMYKSVFLFFHMSFDTINDIKIKVADIRITPNENRHTILSIIECNVLTFFLFITIPPNNFILNCTRSHNQCNYTPYKHICPQSAPASSACPSHIVKLTLHFYAHFGASPQIIPPLPCKHKLAQPF